ncbi:MAG: N-acetyl-1-D-myo-inositol-2-amino-2-deoxy-alpha-D-glucopyranoside deacetylase [Actinomycetales bacterium]
MAPVIEALPPLPGLDETHGLLLVHAHPDDESITTGATMAHYAAAGVPVTLVTCTRGEQGEVIGAEIAHLFGDGEALAAHREAELASAMTALGVTDHRFLGAAQGRRYRDSGMVWGPDGLARVPDDVDPRAFAVADLDTAATELAAVIDQVQPGVVVTYDPGGGYGHPDHVQASRVAARAVELAHSAPRLVWVVAPRSVDVRGRELLRAQGMQVRESEADPSMIVEDDLARYETRGPVLAKAAALRAHASQVIVAPDERSFALSNLVWQPLSGAEYFMDATTG